MTGLGATLLHFHGAAGCVTGSCARLETPHANLLVDCGLFQGTKTLKALNYSPFPFDANKIDAVLLTHAHIDHSGLLPKLMKAGYAGAIHATAGTRALCAVMLPDAGGIQEMEVETLNRRNARRGEAHVNPIYTAADGVDVMAQFRVVALNEWIEVAAGVRARWWNAGHILGSASIEIEIDQDADIPPLRLLFSGDIGPGGRNFLDDPTGPAGLDHIVLESTYGGVARTSIDEAGRQAALAGELTAAHAAGGPLLIPAFAVERTQELLSDLLHVMNGANVPMCPIFLDSPLAIKATEVFLERGREGRAINPFGELRQAGWLRFTESSGESRDIERFRGWHIIIAASGMCDAGRVRHHLKRLLPKPEATIMLVGFQPVGTLGRLLLEGHKDVRIQGEPFRVRAKIRDLDIYSGHADGPGLVRWANARAPIVGTIFLTHGEPNNLQSLERRLTASGIDANRIVQAKLDQAYALMSGARCEPTIAQIGRIEPDAVSRLDWHNARAAFLSTLHDALARASSDSERQAILDRLGEALRPPASA